jgi:ABC-type multidrug transport system permease subunit
MKNLIKVAVLETKFMLRDKISLFFTFIFPFFLLILFGSIWGKYPGYYSSLIPMLISMVALSGGLFGIGIVLARYREIGIFRRLSLTPLSSRVYIMGTMLGRLGMLMAESLALLITLIFVLKQSVKGSILELLLVIIIGKISMLALGGLIASLVKSSDGAVSMGNLIFTPLMFLSGGFIPLMMLPKFLQKIATASPVYHYIVSMQNIIMKGNSLPDEWFSLLFLIVFGGICLLFSRKIFSE